MKVDDRFVSLYQAEYGAILRATYLLCRDRGLAEDATQEAFARALERWSRLQHHDWVAGWIMTTALNCVRRAKRFSELPAARQGRRVPNVRGSCGPSRDAERGKRCHIRQSRLKPELTTKSRFPRRELCIQPRLPGRAIPALLTFPRTAMLL